jgi:hypothetical protein
MYSIEETLKLISDKSKESDNFWVKVQRRAHPGAHPTIVATLSGANVQHFTSPELWIPVLCGGGKFLLQAFHESDANRLLGGAILFPVDGIDVRDVDLSIFDVSGDAKKADWRGPARLEYPKASAPAQQQEMPMYGIKAPPAPGSGDSATNRQAWPRLAGGGVHREAYDDGGPFSHKAGAIEAERRMLEKEKLDAERERHRTEMDGLKKSHDSELKSLESRLLAEIRSVKSTGPDPTIEFFKQMSEDRRAQEARAAEDRRSAETRASEERKQASEDRRASEARFERLLEKLSERKEKDPLEVLKTAAELVRPKNDDSAMMKTVHNMVEMQSSMVGAAMDFVDHASRISLGAGGGEDEPRWMKGIERLVKGVGKMATAAQMRQPVLQLPQQPAGQPQQPAGQQPAGQQPQPQGAPAQKPQQQTQLSVIDQIEAAIRQRYDVKQIAGALIKFYQDQSIQSALEASGGDFELVVQKRLGNWANEAPENATYLKKLFEEVERQVSAAGFTAPDEDEGGDEGGEDAQAEAEEGDEDED